MSIGRAFSATVAGSGGRHDDEHGHAGGPGTSAAAFSEKCWRKDLAEWDSVDKPGAVGKHHALLAVRPGELDDAGRVAHCRDCERHLDEMIDLHHFAGQHATVLGIRTPAAITRG